MSVMRGVPVAAAALRLPRAGTDAAAAAREEEPSPQQVFEAARAAGHREGLDQGRKEGWQRGHEEGLAAGRQEALCEIDARAAEAVAQAAARLQAQQARLAEIAGSLSTAHREVLGAAEDDLVVVVFEAVTRMVTGSAMQPEAVRATVQSALARAARQPRVLLCVHPDDAAVLDAGGPRGEAGQAVAWRADPQVALGGCILESAAGALDLRLEVLLADCRATLLRARAERGAMQQGVVTP